MSKILIIGAGAVGMDLAARFARKSDCQIYFKIRSHPMESIKKICQVNSLKGTDTETFKFQIFCDTKDKLSDFDYAFVCVKAFDLVNVIEWLGLVKTQISDNLVFGFFSNGLGVWEQVIKFGIQAQSFRGLCWFGVKKKSHFEIVRTGEGMVSIGMDQMALALQKSVILFLKTAIPELKICESALFAEWDKGVWNSALNPLAAAFKVNNGEIISDDKLRAMFLLLIAQGLQLAKAMGIDLGEQYLAQVLEATRKTALNRNSLLQDLERGSKLTEFDWLTRSILNYSKLKGINLTAHQSLMHKLGRAWPGRTEFS